MFSPVNWPDNFGTPSDEGETVPLEMAHSKAGSSYPHLIQVKYIVLLIIVIQKEYT